MISSFFWFFSPPSWHPYFFQQAVGYNSIEAEDWELATNGEEMSKLEALLLDKNRKMEHELTQLKVPLVWMLSILSKDISFSHVCKVTMYLLCLLGELADLLVF